VIDDLFPNWSPDRSRKLFGDKGYLSQPLAEQLLVTQGLQLITKLRKKMHNRLLTLSDKLLLRKRAITETINDQLKNIWKTRAFPSSESHQLPGQPGRRAHRLLPSAQEAFSWVATPRSFRGVAYPELTLIPFSVLSICPAQKPGRSGNKMVDTNGDSFLQKWNMFVRKVLALLYHIL
jgi:Transposase DDE domain